jgi:hypothetical protein
MGLVRSVEDGMVRIVLAAAEIMDGIDDGEVVEIGSALLWQRDILVGKLVEEGVEEVAVTWQ